jgi:hypothetical protein
MGLFGKKRSDDVTAHFLSSGALERMAAYGEARYKGTDDPFDTWPVNYTSELSALTPEQQERCVGALAEAVVSTGGWTVYGAEDLIMSVVGSPGKGSAARDTIFEAAIDFQRDTGIPWNALSALEKISWQNRHPGEEWLTPREPPTREQAGITPLPVGQERKLSTLTAAEDSKATYVVHAQEGKYLLQLDYPNDEGTRLRYDQDEADDLYDLYLRLGRGLPIPGVWVDHEFEAFLPYPMPRI